MNRTHPDLDRLRQYSATAGADAPADIAGHLEKCPECRRTLLLLRELPEQVREATSLPIPPEIWSVIVARRSRGYEVILPTASGAWGGEARYRRALVRAAALLLILTGAASATIPGFPGRAWLESHFQRKELGSIGAESDLSPPVERSVRASGILVEPMSGEVAISFTRAASGARAHIRFGEIEQVEITAAGLAADGVFRSGPGRVELLEIGPGQVDLIIPRTLERFSLQIDGTIYLTKEGPRVDILGPSVETVGGEFILSVP